MIIGTIWNNYVIAKKNKNIKLVLGFWKERLVHSGNFSFFSVEMELQMGTQKWLHFLWLFDNHNSASSSSSCFFLEYFEILRFLVKVVHHVVTIRKMCEDNAVHALQYFLHWADLFVKRKTTQLTNVWPMFVNYL